VRVEALTEQMHFKVVFLSFVVLVQHSLEMKKKETQAFFVQMLLCLRHFVSLTQIQQLEGKDKQGKRQA